MDISEELKKNPSFIKNVEKYGEEIALRGTIIASKHKDYSSTKACEIITEWEKATKSILKACGRL